MAQLFIGTSGWAENFTYFRFHGPRELFSSNYRPAELQPWADRILVELKTGKDIYAYFNNDFQAYAPGNAELRRDLLG